MADGAVTGGRPRSWALATCLLVLAAPQLQAHDDTGTDPVHTELEAYAPRMNAVADDLWDWAELGYLETRSSRLLQQELRDAGFQIQHGVAGMPTAFIAHAGSSGPVIALLAEMDALPNMSQVAEPVQRAVQGQAGGHACGHNLFGAGAVAAARAIHAWLQASGTPGQIRVYGTPAEEGGSGKVYMVREGLFDDVDAVLHWHPSDRNSAAQSGSMANVSGRFRFTGVAAHASIAPERGRSALDGVEALNHMANLMREHVPQQTRIHYTISDGGGAPNVVPATAEVYYYVRHPDPAIVDEVFGRLEKAAEGAAMGTGTEVAYEPLGGVYSLLPNNALGRVLDGALREGEGVVYSPGDRAFAEALQSGFERAPPLEQALQVAQYSDDGLSQASTDVGDVSWSVPTAGISTATWVPGTAAHTWQAAAASGHSIGHGGTLLAARTLATAATQLYTEPSTLQEARAELDRRRGKDFAYRPLLQREAPPLDYRLPRTRDD